MRSGSHVAQWVKNPPTKQEMQKTCVQSLGQEDLLEEGNPLQYSCLENPMDRGAWRAIVHSVTELGMTEQLSMAQLYIYFFFCKNEQIFSPVLSYLHQR